MKKVTLIGLVSVLCAGFLTGCGTSYAAGESTVFVEKHGKIISTDVEAFDEGTYDKSELEQYAKDQADSYTAENDKNSVKFKELSVKDGTAALTMEYKNAKAYRGFNGIELFNGTIAEALAAGYRFDVDFALVQDGKAKEAVDSSEFLDSKDLKVVVIRANTDVKVKGTIQYASTENTALKDKSTVSIKKGQNLLTAESGTEEADQTGIKETVNGTEQAEDTEDTEESGSVDEDEMLTGTEEQEMKTFDFSEEDSKKQDAKDNEEFTNVYTYIIYK